MRPYISHCSLLITHCFEPYSGSILLVVYLFLSFSQFCQSHVYVVDVLGVVAVAVFECGHPFFDVGEFLRDGRLQHQVLAHHHKGAHNGDTDFYGSSTFQDGRQHGYTLLREDVWRSP